LAFPPRAGIEALDLDAKLAFHEGKKIYLENLLAKLQAEHASVAVLDTLHADKAAQASAALNAAAAQWLLALLKWKTALDYCSRGFTNVIW
jgi:hypothetical protein